MENLDGSADRSPVWTDNAADIPQEGENVNAALRNPGDGPVRPGFRELANRLDHLRPGAEQAIEQSLVPWVELYAPGESGTASISVRPLGPWIGAHLATGIGRVNWTAFPKTVTAPAGGGAWVVDTWYYLYAAIVAGALRIEASDTIPDAARACKFNDPTRRYLGCFRTYDAGGGVIWIVPMRSVRGRCTYETDQQILAVTAGTGTPQAVAPADVASRIPPHVRKVVLRGQVINNNTGGAAAHPPGGAGILQMWGRGSLSRDLTFSQAAVGTVGGASGHLPIVLDDTQAVNWRLAQGVAGGTLTAKISVAEFEE